MLLLHTLLDNLQFSWKCTYKIFLVYEIDQVPTENREYITTNWIFRFSVGNNDQALNLFKKYNLPAI
jgi:hypothetical protein